MPATEVVGVEELGVRLQARMQPVQLRAIPGSGSSPGRICLLRERGTRQVALQVSVQAAEQLQSACVLPVHTGLRGTASGTGAEVRPFCRLAGLCVRDCHNALCMHAGCLTTGTDPTVLFIAVLRLAYFGTLQRRP